MKTLIFKGGQFFITLILLSMMVYADDVELGLPGYGGSGCPHGSASINLSPDKKSLSILFDEFIVETSARDRLDRKSCSIAVPVHVPQGFSVSILDVDYRGFVSLPRGAMARFSSEYFFAGSKGPIARKTFKGAAEKDFLLSSRLALSSLVWSKCGADVNLRATTVAPIITKICSFKA